MVLKGPPPSLHPPFRFTSPPLLIDHGWWRRACDPNLILWPALREAWGNIGCPRLAFPGGTARPAGYICFCPNAYSISLVISSLVRNTEKHQSPSCLDYAASEYLGIRISTFLELLSRPEIEQGSILAEKRSHKFLSLDVSQILWMD